MDDIDWAKKEEEIELLCKLHSDAIANMAMDILMNCNPKVASHCEKANMEQGMLERMKYEIRIKSEAQAGSRR